MIVYLDTSAFIKLVIDEPGSDLAAELWDRATDVASSQLLYPEVRAALAAAHRQGRLTPATHHHAKNQVDELYDQLSIVRLDDTVARTAGDLAEAQGLRGYDAVHLATAQQITDESLVVATWDHQLADATMAAGRSVLPSRP